MREFVDRMVEYPTATVPAAGTATATAMVVVVVVAVRDVAGRPRRSIQLMLKLTNIAAIHP